MLTNDAKYRLIRLSLLPAVERNSEPFFRKAMIAHDKGKPAARQGRKAVSLSKKRARPTARFCRDCLVAEGDRRKPTLKLLKAESDIIF